MSSSRFRSSVLGNHGLSRQFICTILELAGGFSRKRLCVSLFLRSGFHVTQTSAPSSRTVLTAFDHAVSVTGSASSTQSSRMRAFDLMLSRLRFRPMKSYSIRLSLVRTYFSPTSKFAANQGSDAIAALTSANELSSRLFMNSRPQTMMPVSPEAASCSARTAVILANVRVFADPRPPYAPL